MEAEKTEKKEAGQKRSKIWRVIVFILAAAFFWASRYEVSFNGDHVVRYNKWTGHIDLVSLPGK